MVPPVEARSLSALTELAANPPLHPPDSSAIDGPLVLYIARVPGSKDVFLTTMKPRQKVVTAQDVESSLYYFHVDNADDEDIRESLRYADHSDEGVDVPDGPGIGKLEPEEEKKGVSRKPLPPNSRLAPGTTTQSPPKMHPHFQSPDYVNGPRNSSSVNDKSSSTHYNSKIAPALPPRRLFGPRPMHNRNQSVDTPCTNLSVKKENINPRRWSEQPPELPRRPGTKLAQEVAHGSSRSVNRYTDLYPEYKTPWEKLQSAIAPDKEFAITLIRRDPYSSDQWNAGKLTIDKSKSIRSDGSKIESGVLLEMTSSGYEKFGEHSVKSSATTLSSVNSRSSSDQPEETRPTSSHVSDSENHFQRFLALKQPKQQLASPLPFKKGFRSSMDFRRKDLKAVTSQKQIETESLPSPEHSPTQLKAFMFESPWGGSCEFSTGIAGKSLKLRHTLPRISAHPHTLGTPPSTISELRFNLPSSGLFGLSSAHRPQAPSTSKHSSFPHLSSIDDEDEYDEDERMDLSLGQERAGGGVKGKKAKLGKLIVQAEGLQMLDLVVAANMGVWWSVYERGV